MTLGDEVNGDGSPKAHYGKVDGERMSADDMDARRKENIAYEYLCHLEEAKVWIEACINTTLPPTTEVEEGLRNGVFLGKLGHFINPELVPMKKIYDKDLSRYQARGLHFRHTDNINHWLKALEDVGMPKIFWPETTDIYDRKNMPKVIYCIHALSLYLFQLGKAPQIQDLYGKIKFTDEEISAMRKELEKYGIQMPAFSKIGGILANEMPVDEAALHAAVIAINEAIDHQVTADTVEALHLPAAHLSHIYPQFGEHYQVTLYQAKESKADIARNKSLDPDSSYIPDVYDELLTQAELQGNIKMVNTQLALMEVNKAVKLGDKPSLLGALRLPYLGVREVKEEGVHFYMARLLEIKDNKRNNNNEDLFTRDEVQMAVNAANLDMNADHQKYLAVKAINDALDCGDREVCMRALKNPYAEIPPVHQFAAALYLEELRSMKCEKQSIGSMAVQNGSAADLDHDELVNGIQVLSAIACVNQAVEAGNSGLVMNALAHPEAHIASVDQGCQDKYLKKLTQAQSAKSGTACELLTYFDIQRSVNEVNMQVASENDRIGAVGKINEAVERGVAVETLAALQAPAACLPDIDPSQALHYHNLLTLARVNKIQQTSDPTSVLWYEEIRDTVQQANRQAEDGNKMSVCIAAVNIAVDSVDSQTLITCLMNPDSALHSVTPKCEEMYLAKLADFKERKAQAGEGGSGWMMNRLREGHKFYFNVNNMDYSWERYDGMKKDYSLLTRDEIQTCVSNITAAYDRQLLFKANERFVVVLQARVRGYLARKAVEETRRFNNQQLPAICRIQAWWRMICVRRLYQARLDFLNRQQRAAVLMQSATRGFLARLRYNNRLDFFRRNEWAVIKIQAFIRSNLAKKDYRTLMHGQNPSLSVVRRFVHLMDIGDLDYSEEIELEKLRQQVVTEIRSNQQLEGDLNQMDIKIGLLVKNRITLQDVISQHKSLKKYRDDSTSSLHKAGLKALSKQNRDRLEAYQNLFYLLQTNPTYLAKLIFEMPQSRTTKFMESVILTLYNYASNQREEYLLLKLFKTALQEEIQRISKVDKMADIVTGNPLVVKMIVSFNRNARGQGGLRDLLNPLVKAVIDNRNLQINTNPTETYKQWVNQMETQSGKASGLPYEVTPEQALQHQEVRDLIQKSVDKLQQATECFLQAILSSVDKIPYAMRYMAKVMQDALRAKFPDAPEKDILKIIGNLIYYRYINSAIVAPDAFDIIDVGANKGLTNDQRRNLGSIAKILQFAASNKGFGGDSAHLSCLNKYIMDAHNRFKKFFRNVCDVEEPEQRFNMDQYTDVTRVTKPVIYISIAEIIDTHKLLLEHQDSVAPDPADPLHEILDDLRDVPEVETLIGEGGDDNLANRAQVAKTEISLTLSNKFEVPEDDRVDINNIMIRTKSLVIDVIRCQSSGETLAHVLQRPATSAEENIHKMLIKKREQVDQKAVNKKAKLMRKQSMAGDSKLSLEEMKVKIAGNLKSLESAGLVSRYDHYQAILNSIVQDLRKQRLYRQRRKQEMMRLRNTIKSLSSKRAFYEEQIDYYNQYVKTCLDNLSTKAKKSGKRSSIFGKPEKAQRVKGSIKYSAARLHEKGVILEIEGLPTNQFKNVLFEISATTNPGIFDVSAKFMGVNMEKVELIFQDLLQLQYEGVAVMQMFDKAKVNVNLLVFLLNKKFYGK